MNKKLVAALSGGAALVLMLTGCGGDDGDKKLDDWAKKVCGNMQPQVKKVLDANSAIASLHGEENSKKVQQTDSAAFQDNADAYKSLATSIDSAGAPPVKDGETTQKNAVKALNDLSGAYEGLKKQIDGLNTSDKQKFSDGLNGIVSGLNKLNGKSEDALKKLQAGDVGKAMTKQPGCRRTSTSVSPSDSASPSASKK
ncbi:small secreted protein [Streptomyces sp. NPDC050617]|uniref:small secreted protein n=1 Tax=Streptomyces sp. NPDC050617 TaxID=3154628 RepID=UPI003433F486